MRRLLILGATWAAGTLAIFQEPASLPARDAHQNVVVAADPYLEAARYKERFGKKNPYKKGILAVEVFCRNDNDKPIRVDLSRIRLLLNEPGSERQRLVPMTVEDVVERTLRKEPEANKPRPRIPIPGRVPGSSGNRGKDWDELETALRSVAFEMDVLPPRSSVKGFFFFDLDGQYQLVEHARLYLPDLVFLHNNEALLFFEIELAKAKK